MASVLLALSCKRRESTPELDVGCTAGQTYSQWSGVNWSAAIEELVIVSYNSETGDECRPETDRIGKTWTSCGLLNQPKKRLDTSTSWHCHANFLVRSHADSKPIPFDSLDNSSAICVHIDMVRTSLPCWSYEALKFYHIFARSGRTPSQPFSSENGKLHIRRSAVAPVCTSDGQR